MSNHLIAAKRAELAKVQAELDALEASEPSLYPKALYRRQEDGALETKIVKSDEEQQALGAGWCESPADCPKAAE